MGLEDELVEQARTTRAMKLNNAPRVIVFSTLVILLVLVVLFRRFESVRRTSVLGCWNNLVLLQQYKNEWMRDKHKTPNDTPTWDDILPYSTNRWANGRPVCRDGGIYTLGRVGEPPSCSIGGSGHSFPDLGKTTLTDL
jgi:hypothetical protein